MKRFIPSLCLAFGILVLVTLEASQSFAIELKIAGRTPQLEEVASGIRTKKVAFLNVDVYHLKIYTSEKGLDRTTRETLLEGLTRASMTALRLEFLRDVDAEKVLDGFQSSLKENGVPLEEPALTAFLQAVKTSGEAKKGKSLKILFEKSAQSETLHFENEGSGKSSSLPAPLGTARKLLLIWLGKPADSGLEKLQSALIHP